MRDVHFAFTFTLRQITAMMRRWNSSSLCHPPSLRLRAIGSRPQKWIWVMPCSLFLAYRHLACSVATPVIILRPVAMTIKKRPLAMAGNKVRAIRPPCSTPFSTVHSSGTVVLRTLWNKHKGRSRLAWRWPTRRKCDPDPQLHGTVCDLVWRYVSW